MSSFDPGHRRRILASVLLSLFLVAVWQAWLIPTPEAEAQPGPRPTLRWGSRGASVRLVQERLRRWGYYQGPVDGVFGRRTYQSVRLFQRRNGLAVDGIVGRRTYVALGINPGVAAAPAPTPARRQAGAVAARGATRANDINLLARLVRGEAEAEPYNGKVAVAAVCLNRVQSSRFPNTLAGVIYQPGAFEVVRSGRINLAPRDVDIRAARDAINGFDPTYGALFFWNPAKPVNPWIWTRRITLRIGRHVFGL
jgi:N-acetylmuramoyl-L-alanine amidase